MRGAWVLDRILGQPAPPPPPECPAVEPDIRGATTIREQLAKHRAAETCASCHAQIDPPGFALENFDVIGGWRDRYRIVAERKDWVNNRVGPLAKYLAAYQYGLGRPVEAGEYAARRSPVRRRRRIQETIARPPRTGLPQHHRETRDLCDGTTGRF